MADKRGSKSASAQSVLNEYVKIAKSAVENMVVIKHESGRSYVQMEPREPVRKKSG